MKTSKSYKLICKRQHQIAELKKADELFTLRILGVTLTTGLSASDHVRDIISKSAQTLYTLRVLRAKGMPDDALQVVFRSVIVGKLL